MSTLYLIRHGKTAANQQHLYCGSTDLPLSPAGKEELRQLQYRLSATRFVTSGMKRTNETLEILFGNVPFSVDLRLREVDFGAFEMHSYEQLKDTPAYQSWLTGDNERNVPPQGESGLQMQTRVLAALQELTESDTDTVVVTHGGVIAAIMAHLYPEDAKNRYQWQPCPGHGYALTPDGFLEIP